MIDINGVGIKFIEVPSGANLQDKFTLLNMWMNDMQRNGIVILSTSQLERQDNADGSVTEGFSVEWRIDK